MLKKKQILKECNELTEYLGLINEYLDLMLFDLNGLGLVWTDKGGISARRQYTLTVNVTANVW